MPKIVHFVDILLRKNVLITKKAVINTYRTRLHKTISRCFLYDFMKMKKNEGENYRLIRIYWLEKI